MNFLKSLYPRKCILKLMKKNPSLWLSQVNIVTSVQLSDLGLMRQANPFLFILHTKLYNIYPKYSKHWPYTVAHTIDCVCSKMLNHGLNHWLFLSPFKLIPCHIHWIIFMLAYLNFIFEFQSSFSTAQNGPLCPDT